MSETPWSSGPWRVHDAHHVLRGYTAISSAPQKPDTHIGLALVVTKLEGHPYKQGDANARLIAAAPELAEALANTLRLAEELFEIAPSPRQQDIIDEARAALAKARGEAAQ